MKTDYRLNSRLPLPCFFSDSPSSYKTVLIVGPNNKKTTKKQSCHGHDLLSLLLYNRGLDRARTGNHSWAVWGQFRPTQQETAVAWRLRIVPAQEPLAAVAWQLVTTSSQKLETSAARELVIAAVQAQWITAAQEQVQAGPTATAGQW